MPGRLVVQFCDDADVAREQSQQARAESFARLEPRSGVRWYGEDGREALANVVFEAGWDAAVIAGTESRAALDAKLRELGLDPEVTK